MRIEHDDDALETVVTSRPCTSCGGDLKKCNGGCNGMFSMGSRRRSSAEVAAIKAKRRLDHEELVLAEAVAIKARRLSGC